MIYYLEHNFNIKSNELLTSLRNQILDEMKLFFNVKERCVLTKKFHITIMYSKNPFGRFMNTTIDNSITSNTHITYTSDVAITKLHCFESESNVHVVLKLHAPAQIELHNQLMSTSDATYDYVEYNPHCTLFSIAVKTVQERELILKIIDDWNTKKEQSYYLETLFEIGKVFKDSVDNSDKSSIPDTTLNKIIEHLSLMTAQSRAEDGLGKFLGDGIPRKDDEGNEYVLRTGVLVQLLQELRQFRK